MKILRSYWGNQSGQFAIMFSVVATALLGCMMIAIDINRMISTKSKVAAITDAAALAGANAFDNPDRILIVQEFLNENAAKMLPAEINGLPEIDFDDAAGEVRVYIDTNVDLPFAAMFGTKAKDIGYKSLAAFPKGLDPLTIAFALDVSGSMGGLTSDGQVKLTALKDATSQMFAEIEDGVRNKSSIDEHFRTGLSAFNSGLAAEHDMSWGFLDIENAVKGLQFGGATNTSVALENAHNQILRDRSFRKSHDPSVSVESIDEFVIFMTDGANTAGDPFVLDENSYQSCLSMREDGIEVYAVAFTAPDAGQLLLMNCASWDDENEDKKSKNARNDRRRCGEDANLGNSSNRNRDSDDMNSREQALARCRADVLEDKKEHYFDAADAKSFKEIFRIIGQKINESSIRIKS